jgi:hypothetical protein
MQFFMLLINVIVSISFRFKGLLVTVRTAKKFCRDVLALDMFERVTAIYKIFLANSAHWLSCCDIHLDHLFQFIIV